MREDSYSTNINVYWEIEKVEPGRGYQSSQSFYLTPNTVNTEKALAELTAYGTLPSSGDIEKIYLHTEKARNGEAVSEREIKNPEEIEEIYALYSDMLSGETFTKYETSVNVYLNYTLKNGYSFDVSCTYDVDKLPEIFR